MRSAIVVTVVAAALALVVTEAGMRPSVQERVTLYGVFALAVAVAGAVSWLLIRSHRRSPSLRWTIVAVAVAAVVLAAAVVSASAVAMVLSPPDVRVVLAALTLGTGLGLLVAIGVTGALATDLRVLSDAAREVADGNLDVRTGIERRDEVGELAASLDRMVDQLAQLQAERERGQDARRRLLASVGHDLRTPLASLRAAIEALQDGVAPDPDRYLRSMGGDVDLLRSMVDDLFVLTRLEAGDLQLERLQIDLAEVAEGAVEASLPLAGRKRVELQLDNGAAVPVVADPRALDRTLRNLLDNAIRHSPEGGTVQVAVTPDRGGTVRVRDEGPGFPDDFADHAFELFSRADAARERGGAGLGLAIAREFVEAHGGAIWIEPGAGGTLAFRLGE